MAENESDKTLYFAFMMKANSVESMGSMAKLDHVDQIKDSFHEEVQYQALRQYKNESLLLYS